MIGGLPLTKVGPDPSGPYRITGTVARQGAAGQYRVRLFDRANYRCLRETWSAADGSFAFSALAYAYQGYFVVAFDNAGTPLNATIADLVTPEPTP